MDWGGGGRLARRVEVVRTGDLEGLGRGTDSGRREGGPILRPLSEAGEAGSSDHGNRESKQDSRFSNMNGPSIN